MVIQRTVAEAGEKCVFFFKINTAYLVIPRSGTQTLHPVPSSGEGRLHLTVSGGCLSHAIMPEFQAAGRWKAGTNTYLLPVRTIPTSRSTLCPDPVARAAWKCRLSRGARGQLKTRVSYQKERGGCIPADCLKLQKPRT